MGEIREYVCNPDIFTEDIQQDIRNIISHNFVKIIKINLTDDTYQKIMSVADDPAIGDDYTWQYSKGFIRVAEEGYINEEDRKYYLSFCNLDHIRRRFQSGDRYISCHYRRKMGDQFRWVSIEIVAGREYRDDYQIVFLYVRDIHDDYLQQLDFAVRRTKNALSVVNLNLTENLYESGYGDYASLVMDEPDRTADDYLDYLGQSVQGKNPTQEFAELINRKHLLEQFAEGKTYITFTGAFLLVQGKRRTLKFTVAMERNTLSGDVGAVLYTMDVTREYLQSHFIPMLYRSNYQTIGIIDLQQETVVLAREEFDISQLLHSEIPYEQERQRVCMENISPGDRESYLMKTTLEELKKKLAESDSYAFPIYYEEDGEKRIMNYRFRYLSEEFGMVMLTVEDVTSLSEKDALTGGMNQQGFIKKLENLMKKQSEQEKYVILCIDVKNFKAINELFGVTEGNDLLRKLYRDIERSFLEPLITARVEADQYFCLAEWDKLDYDKLNAWCERDYLIKGKKFRVSKRCGVYGIQDPTIAVRSMCDRARLALSIAKSERSTKPYVLFDDAMSAEYIDRSEILGQFGSSLKNREFCIYLQPVIDPVSGRISSAEALVRWYHPKKGFISPQYFIPALERNGYISRLDLYVAREVERFQEGREQKGLPVVPVSINLSWMDFYDDELLEWINSYVESKKDRNHTIRFEITESSYAAVAENRSLLFTRLREQGAQFLLDDFGSGYSSFSILQNYDFDILKIDIGFVRRIEECDKTKSIICSIIKMVHQMDAKVVAEGAETREQVELLKERGCDYIQGYYYYKPMPMEEFGSILDSFAQDENVR